MTANNYEPTDRRPIASRERPVWKRIAARLAARRISPNAISIAGMVAALVGSVCLALTGQIESPWIRGLWLAAAACTQLRLIANLLDGMVAIDSGRASPLGELYNELPDRVSDAALFIGAGYAAGSEPVAGYLAACLAIFTAYVRAVGKASGVINLFLGPMAKPQRMFVLTVTCLYLALAPESWQPTWRGWGLMAAALALICAGAVVTSVRRIARIARQLHGAA